MNGPVTVGFDGSPQALAAAHWAVHEAGLRGARLELLQAWPWAAPHLLGTPDAVREGRTWLTRAEAELNALLPGVEVSGAQMPTSAEDALAAASRTSSLMVLGSRGLGSLRGFLVGSVSRSVLGRAVCPVVLVRAPDEPGEPGDESQVTAEVVLGLDLGHPCDELLDFAFEAAGLRSVPLRVVHAWQPPTVSQYMTFAAIASLDRELAAEERRDLHDTLTPWRAKYPDVEVTVESLHGSAAATLVEAAGRPELLVVGRRNRPGALGAHLGHVTQAAVHHVHSPIAVVPHE